MLNYLMRGLALAIKALFIVVLAKFINVGEVAIYGLFNACLSLLVFFAGCEFYTYSQREIMKEELPLATNVKGHFLVVLIMTVFVYTIAFVFFDLNAQFDSAVLLLLAIIGLLELISQDIGRMLIATGQIYKSTLVFLIRSALWPLVVVFMFAIDEVYRDISYVYWIWLVSALLSVLFGVRKLGVGVLAFRTAPIPKPSWFVLGIRVSFVYLCSALLIKLVFAVDRFLVGEGGGSAELASYVLFMGMALSMQSFLAATLFSFSLPKLIKSHIGNNYALFRATAINLGINTTVLLVAMNAVLILMAPYILSWIGRDEYLEFSYLMIYTLIVSSSFSLAMMSHQLVYAMRLDKDILYVRLWLIPLAVVLFMILDALSFDVNISIQVCWVLSAMFVINFIVNLLIAWKKSQYEQV